jgi:hypothetical protein
MAGPGDGPTSPSPYVMNIGATYIYIATLKVIHHLTFDGTHFSNKVRAPFP